MILIEKDNSSKWEETQQNINHCWISKEIHNSEISVWASRARVKGGPDRPLDHLDRLQPRRKDLTSKWYRKALKVQMLTLLIILLKEEWIILEGKKVKVCQPIVDSEDEWNRISIHKLKFVFKIFYFLK